MIDLDKNFFPGTASDNRMNNVMIMTSMDVNIIKPTSAVLY